MTYILTHLSYIKYQDYLFICLSVGVHIPTFVPLVVLLFSGVVARKGSKWGCKPLIGSIGLCQITLHSGYGTSYTVITQNVASNFIVLIIMSNPNCIQMAVISK